MASTTTTGEEVGKLLEDLLVAEADRVFCESARALLLQTDEYDERKTWRFSKPENDKKSLVFELLKPSEATTTFEAERDLRTGAVMGVKEVACQSGGGTARSSMSLLRAPDSVAPNRLMGSATNVPFLPGGMEEDLNNVMRLAELQHAPDDDNLKYLDFSGELLTRAPGISQGGDFQSASAASNTVVDSKIRSEPSGSAASTQPSDQTTENTDVAADIFALMDLVGGGGPIAPPESESSDEEELADSHSEAPDASGKGTTQEDGGEANELDKALSTAVVGPAPSLLDANKVKAVPAAYQFAQSLDATREVPAYKDLFPNMARKYPFHLDPFQQQAALCLEKGESVFVAAHTSAGKTVVAEYAVALCQLHQTRAIYTSPIKALSNQKFREFKLAFEDVGLVTGDIQLHPEAFCLIMTTEILRSMLYNGSEVIRELEWVIFDEVHYINDTERGHVWEEVLIMLPSHVKLIMLSATAPNCMEFADWVGRIKNRTINVITTPKRPVPLEHFLYTGQDGKTKNDRFLLVDKTGQYLARGYSAASQAKANLKKATSGPKGYRPTNKSDKNVWISLIDHLKTNDLLPAVAFVFSRQRCDDNAAMLTTIDLTTQKEKAEVHAFFVRCISRLKGSDRKLPQVTQMQELCKRGLAVHHSGILPILKEVVELLFQQGYVKILFATETFAMGVNMPARTVVFDSMQKHDGREMRNLNPGEYIQMAGRAGRRGLDSTGTVILLCKGPEAPDPTSLTQMMMGTPTKLESQFRVTYSMLLNLLRVEQLRVEDMLQRSYVESASLRQGMSRKIRLKEVEERLKNAKEPDCRTCTEGNLPEYHSLMRQFVRLRSELWTTLAALPAVDKMLTPCRVVIISHGAHIRNRVALILKTATNQKGQKSMSVLISVPESEQFETLSGDDDSKMNEVDRAWRQETMAVMDGALVGLDHVAPPKPGSRSTFKVLPDVPVEALIAITTKVVKGDMGAVLNDWQLREQPRFRSRSPDAGVMRLVAELDSLADEWQKSGPPIVTPGKDFQCSEMSLVERVHSLKQMKNAIAEFACHHCISFGEHLTQHREVVRLREERDQLAFQLSAGSLLLMGEYEDKLKVLRTMDYVDANNLVGLKGKVGCEIHHMELLITELMLENKFSELSSAEIAAMLSCTTCQFRARGEQSKLKPHLQKLKEDVLAVAAKITRVQHDCGVRMSDISEELRFDLIEVVYEWANGVPFSQIMQLTDAQEGLIVRCIQRLNEVCRDVRNAARIVGDPSLQTKMEETSTAIKRDIVFAASLYTVTKMVAVTKQQECTHFKASE